MKTMPAAMVVAMGLGTAMFPPGADKPKCQKVVLADTVRLFSMPSEHTVMMSTSKDTVPKPYKTCVTLYATSTDTVPKPKK